MVIVDITEKFSCKIDISKDGINWVNAKSMVHLCMIGAMCNDEVTIRANGSDEVKAINSLINLIEKGFGEIIVEINNEYKNL
jgi:phosphocarrier protein